jgi:hypothetical protein
LPASTEGSVLTDALDLSADQTAKIKQAESIQQDLLWKTYQNAVGQQGSDTDRPAAQILRVGDIQSLNAANAARARLPRAVVVGLLFAAILYAFWRNRSASLVWLIAGAGVYVVVFNFMYAVVDGRAYSFSSLVGATDLVISSLINCAIALMLGWLLIVFKRKVLQAGPSETAGVGFQFLAIIGVFLLIQLAWSFIANGVLVTWALPEMTSFYFGLLSLVQFLVVGVLGLVLIGVSALVSKYVSR